jgi:ABC-type nitrate/sulfonate/bicarbonate transport system permease component
MNTPKDVPDGKKQISKGEGITAVVVLIIFVLVAWQAISTTPKNDNVPPPSAVVQPEQHSDIEVFVDAQGIVLKALKSPSTAKFPSSSHATIVRGKDDVFKVDSK